MLMIYFCPPYFEKEHMDMQQVYCVSMTLFSLLYLCYIVVEVFLTKIQRLGVTVHEKEYSL